MGGRKVVSLSILLYVFVQVMQCIEANPMTRTFDIVREPQPERRLDNLMAPNPLASRDRIGLFRHPASGPIASESGLQIGGLGVGGLPSGLPGSDPLFGRNPLLKPGLDVGLGIGQDGGFEMGPGPVQRPGLDLGIGIGQGSGLDLATNPMQRQGFDLNPGFVQRSSFDLGPGPAFRDQEPDMSVDRIRFPGFGFRPPFRGPRIPYIPHIPHIPHIHPIFHMRPDSMYDQNLQMPFA